MNQSSSKNTKISKFSGQVGVTLNCLLLTRYGDEKTATREAFKDEVDIYISSLMAAFNNPARAEHLKPYLNEPDLDLFRRLQRASDARVKYVIYRTEDDLLVTTVAFFDNADPDSYSREPERTNGKQGQMGRGETHFRFAYTYSHLVADVDEAIGGVLDAIATGFDKYVTIVTYLQGEPYNLERRFKDAEVYVLDRSIEESIKQLKIKIKQNEFLDAYLKLKDASDMRPGYDDLKHRVDLLAAELRELDPSFTFDPI
jgi:hypothetical protein